MSLSFAVHVLRSRAGGDDGVYITCGGMHTPNVCVRCGHVEEGMGIGTGYCDFSVYRYVDKDNHVLACSNCGVYEYSGLTGELELWSHARNCYDTACWD